MKFYFGNLNINPYSLHPISIYVHRITITPRMHNGNDGISLFSCLDIYIYIYIYIFGCFSCVLVGENGLFPLFKKIKIKN